MKTFHKRFPTVVVNYLCADREFIGQAWVRYLLLEPALAFRVQIRGSDQIEHDGKVFAARVVFAHLQVGQSQCLTGTCWVCGYPVAVEALRLDDGDLLVVIGSIKVQGLVQDYALRFGIEIKNHGRRAKSLFRLGLDYLRHLVFNPSASNESDFATLGNPYKFCPVLRIFLDSTWRLHKMFFKELQHRKVPSSLLDGKKTLDIGCGRKKIAGSVGLDYMSLPGVDIVADLNKKLPIDDDEFEAVHADQVLEHIENLIGLMYEIHRILKPGGIFLAHVPYFRSSWAHIDPTHVRCFTIQSMNYFVKGTYEYENYRFNDTAFESLESFLDTKWPSTLKKKLFTSLALRHPARFENSFLSNLYPFYEISYVLRK